MLKDAKEVEPTLAAAGHWATHIGVETLVNSRRSARPVAIVVGEPVLRMQREQSRTAV